MQNLTIDAASWPVLTRLLDAALDLPPSDREAWLDELGSEYGDLKPRLRDLLSRAESGTGIFGERCPARI